MDNFAADFIIDLTEPLQAEFDLTQEEPINCTFEVYASGTVWGGILGELSNQTDLQAALDLKADKTELNSAVSELNTAIQNEATTRTENDTLLQNNINTLSQTVTTNYNTLDGKIDTEISNRTTADTTLQGNINTLSGTVTNNYNALDARITTNTVNISDINTTLSGYGNIVTHNVSEFATSAQGTLADTALQPNDNISELVNDVGYITSASLPTDYVPETRTINGYALSSNITLNYTDVGALSASTTINDLTTIAQQNALNSGATTTNIGQITTNANDISDIQDLIPNQASSSNQLADKSFVNSSIATNTANFIGTFNSVAELEAYTGTLTNNDYAFVATTDAAGNTLYDRYKYNADTQEWLFEYELNNSSFTAQQWASINSGATSTNIGQIATNANNITDLQTNKQDVLTAGANVQINNNVISATDTTYTAGTGISIVNGVISNTQTSAEWGNIQGTLSNQTDLRNALDRLVTLSTAQTISGRKTFTGEKAIYFKQNDPHNRLGFTLYSRTNDELAAFEYRPDTIGNNALININTSYNNACYVGFRYWGTTSTTVNIVAPKVATAGNYYIPVNFTDGTNTVTANNVGTVDITSLLPDVSDMATQTWVTNQGYTTNIGTVTSVNNIQPDTSGNITLTIPDTATWGNITGTLADQTDLQDALDAKQNTISDLSTIRSGASAGATALQPNDNITELVNNAGYITSSALNGYATESFVTSQGYITGITSSDVITALGYTPYNATNPNGYITASALTPYALSADLASVATSGDYDDLINKPTIPTVNNGTLTIQKNGTTIGTFTANQSTNSTINIEADTVLTDDVTVSKNSDDELQAIGVIDDNSGNAIKTWTGTKAQYDAIVTKDATTLYNITDDTDTTLTLLELLFPVGAVYFGTMSTCPLQTLGVGTWQALPPDKVIQIAGTRGSVGTTVNESLPNIKSSFSIRAGGDASTSEWLHSTYSRGASTASLSTTGNAGSVIIGTSASLSSSTYQDNAPVQQDAYLLNGWRRIA